MKNFNCAEITLTLEQWGDENDPYSNWTLIKDAACFTHNYACEFIIHVGSDEFRHDHFLNYEIKKLCLEAFTLGFNYVCFVG